jgi:hypothetical protein
MDGEAFHRICADCAANGKKIYLQPPPLAPLARHPHVENLGVAPILVGLEGSRKPPRDLLLSDRHRWLAYRKISNGDDRDIPVLVYPVTAPHDQLKLAAKLNSDHGWQLSEADKEHTANALYAYDMNYDDIAAALRAGSGVISRPYPARTSSLNVRPRILRP